MNCFKPRHLLVCYYSMQELGRTSFKDLIRILYHLIFYKIFFEGEKAKNLFFLSPPRKDQIELLDTVFNQCPNNKSKLLIKRKFFINYYTFFCLFRYLYKIFTLRTIKLDEKEGFCVKLNGFEQLLLYIYVLQLYDIIHSIKKFGFDGVSNFIVLGDVWPPESILVDFFNSKDIQTISCQHALYPPNTNRLCVDFFNLMYALPQIRLVWGVAHNQIYEKYSPDIKIVVCGNPKLVKNLNNPTRTIGVATDYRFYSDYNKKMLQIVQMFAKEKGYTVKWRKHPNDLFENYDIDNDIIRIDSYLDDCEFIVAHTTTMFFSYLARGIKAIRYKSDVPFFDLDESIQFSNQKEFDDIVRDIDNIDFSQISKSFIECIGEESKAKYNGFFSTLDRN